LSKRYKRYTKTKPSLNQDGTERTNSLHRRITDAIATSEIEIKQIKTEKAQLPERVDVAGLSDYRSFKPLDNEGKSLFDFVTTAIWNSCRKLHDGYAKDNDRVDLRYAIFNCQGWIRSDDRWGAHETTATTSPTLCTGATMPKTHGLGSKSGGSLKRTLEQLKRMP